MPSDPDQDAQLMLLVKDGDVDAFELLVEKYKQPVMNVIFRILRDATEAEDIAQNVFIQVHKSALRYEATAKFTTWLFTIARNLSLNEIRRRNRHPADSLDAQQDQDDSGWSPKQFEDVSIRLPTDEALRSELESMVDLAISALPENQRTALLLYQKESLPYDEIASIMNCSLSATKSIIHRARETLKKRLKPYLLTGKWETPAA
jgi:RNA polymerase sigma-70 factor (ECF subfamily)